MFKIYVKALNRGNEGIRYPFRIKAIMVDDRQVAIIIRRCRTARNQRHYGAYGAECFNGMHFHGCISLPLQLTIARAYRVDNLNHRLSSGGDAQHNGRVRPSGSGRMMIYHPQVMSDTVIFRPELKPYTARPIWTHPSLWFSARGFPWRRKFRNVLETINKRPSVRNVSLPPLRPCSSAIYCGQ